VIKYASREGDVDVVMLQEKAPELRALGEMVETMTRLPFASCERRRISTNVMFVEYHKIV